MYPRRRPRWETPFGRFISEFGVSRLVRELSGDPLTAVSTHAVYWWISGRRQPRPPTAQAIVRIAEGRLTLEHVYSHSQRVAECKST